MPGLRVPGLASDRKHLLAAASNAQQPRCRCIHSSLPSRSQLLHLGSAPVRQRLSPAGLLQPVHPSHQRRRQALRCCAGSSAAAAAEPPASVSSDSGVLRKLGAVLVVAALVAGCIAASRGPSHPPFASLTAAVSSLPADRLQPTFRSGWAGLAAGCLHSLSGPDHLAALTPLTFGRGQVKATLLGALWGFGHCIGQLFLGLLLLILKDRFTQFIPALSKYSSTTVALTLVVIGVLGLQETFHTHREAELQLIGAGGSGTDPAVIPITATEAQREQQLEARSIANRLHGLRHNFSLWTLATGVVYGLQPDALFVIIPALALPTPLAAIAYMVMFVVGTVTAMGSYTAFIGATSGLIDKSNTSLLTKLSGMASGIAIGVGLFILCSSWNIAITGLS